MVIDKFTDGGLGIIKVENPATYRGERRNESPTYHSYGIKDLERLLRDAYNAIEPTQVLDKGFVRTVDRMGNDDAVVQAARVSYGKGTKTVSDNIGLINRLMKDRHTSCFEMCEIKLHIKLPIFIARQWVRHRTANLNEYSGRYSKMNMEFYQLPTERIRLQNKSNKQGSGDEATDSIKSAWLELSSEAQEAAIRAYTFATDSDMAREIARIDLPLDLYTEWYWKIDLHNLLHFLKLRNSEHAQYEIREYAKAIEKIVAEWCPITYEAWVRYVRDAKTLTLDQIEALKNKGSGRAFSLPKREEEEVLKLLGE